MRSYPPLSFRRVAPPALRRRSPKTRIAELYGKCSNPYGHGHDYMLDVTAEGPVNPQSGQVVHIPTLDRLVSEQVLQGFRSPLYERGLRRVPDAGSDLGEHYPGD